MQTFQLQIQALDDELAPLRENLEGLKANSEASAAASVEHEALLKAQADFATIQEEITALQASHTAALEEASSKVKGLEEELKEKTSTLDALSAQIAELKTEKEETANKVSELEIEILELKEGQESAEEERSSAAQKTKALEDELATAIAATQKVLVLFFISNDLCLTFVLGYRRR